MKLLKYPIWAALGVYYALNGMFMLFNFENTGLYLNQFQKFTPDLEESCPNPIDELKAFGPYEEAACRSFVGQLPSCRSFVGSLPGNISFNLSL